MFIQKYLIQSSYQENAKDMEAKWYVVRQEKYKDSELIGRYEYGAGNRLSETETGDEGAFNLELNSGRCVLEVGDRSMGQSIRAVLP